MNNDKRVPLVSFTGSTRIGRRVSGLVAERFGKTILELGGNNAIIVMDDADLELATRSILFASCGTAGQRCTTCRRVILHEKIYDKLLPKLLSAYKTLRIGDPLKEGTLVGPLHTKAAVRDFEEGLKTILSQGGKVLHGGRTLPDLEGGGGNFVEPTIIEIDHKAPIVKEELFVPILYILITSSFEEAISINNEVPQGLSSSVFTNNPASIFTWIGPNGSDCGIVNVNIPTN